jgi:two-component system LytT family response regulator
MSTILRCLIVDDESDARKFLRKRLVPHPELEVIGEAVSLSEALAFCLTLRPDVVFLDIHMPPADGLRLPALLPVESRPAIVFVTAYEEHAVEAFELNAVDYLLKPYPPQRVAATVDKLRLHFNSRIALKAAASPAVSSSIIDSQVLGSIMVQEQKQLLQLDPLKIAFIKTVGDYTRLTLITNQSYMLRQSLTRWEELLPTEIFFRVDRFRIINLSCVEKVERLSRNKMLVYLMGLNQPKELRRIASARLSHRLKARLGRNQAKSAR